MANVFDNSGGAVAVDRPSIFGGPGVGTESRAAPAEATGEGTFAAAAISRQGPPSAGRATGRIPGLAAAARLMRARWSAAAGLLVALCVALALPLGGERHADRPERARHAAAAEHVRELGLRARPTVRHRTARPRPWRGGQQHSRLRRRRTPRRG